MKLTAVRILLFLLTLTFAMPIAYCNDVYVRKNVVMLTDNEGGSCTGIRIKTKKNRYYILTAEHCLGLAQPLFPTNKQLTFNPFAVITVLSNGGSKVEVMGVVATNPFFDLMLLESRSGSGVSIATNTVLHEKVHTMTHGEGFPIYRSDGELMAEEYDMTERWAGYGRCAIKTMATAFIVPGSSGGPLLNAKDELIGIATTIDRFPFFGFFTPLSQIQAFLKGR